MLLILIRIVAVVVGTYLFLPSFALALNAIEERVWEAAVLAVIAGIVGAWMLCAGWYGTLSGTARKSVANSSARLPNTR